MKVIVHCVSNKWGEKTMAIIVKKGQLEKLNKNISQRRLEERKTYTVAEYP